MQLYSTWYDKHWSIQVTLDAITKLDYEIPSPSLKTTVFKDGSRISYLEILIGGT